MKNREQKGTLVVLSGPSGVGKTTICKKIANRLENVYLSISITTRQLGRAEKQGESYRCVSRRNFEKMVEQNELLEYAELFGNWYGTAGKPVQNALNQGKTVILEIDTQGAKQILSTHRNAELIFILPPTRQKLADRIQSRARDKKKQIEERLRFAKTETDSAKRYYNHFVVNDNLEEAVTKVIDIIRNARGEHV